ncbi:hypothetical protein [Nocardiopsis sp. NRRL B-16309]|uniref:hypothetical protein n=1 Tax=Nocardiopsis sp. NRRL B-16309 TaxID=1519494 RepID=UPI0012E25946|nr:hypothetical protein [Nocardiopsis sp. NRRL B-16309]
MSSISRMRERAGPVRPRWRALVSGASAATLTAVAALSLPGAASATGADRPDTGSLTIVQEVVPLGKEGEEAVPGSPRGGLDVRLTLTGPGGAGAADQDGDADSDSDREGYEHGDTVTIDASVPVGHEGHEGCVVTTARLTEANGEKVDEPLPVDVTLTGRGDTYTVTHSVVCDGTEPRTAGESEKPGASGTSEPPESPVRPESSGSLGAPEAPEPSEPPRSPVSSGPPEPSGPEPSDPAPAPQSNAAPQPDPQPEHAPRSDPRGSVDPLDESSASSGPSPRPSPSFGPMSRVGPGDRTDGSDLGQGDLDLLSGGHTGDSGQDGEHPRRPLALTGPSVGFAASGALLLTGLGLAAVLIARERRQARALRVGA